MDINSIIDTIKRSIITGTPAGVKITDKSFLAELLGKDEDGDDAPGRGARLFYVPRFNKAVRFPVTHYIMQCLWSALTALITSLYWLASALLWLFTGRWKDLYASARFNAVMFIACIVCYIVVLAFSITFLLKNVLFFSPDKHVNSQGAIMMKQPLGVEKYMFLFNSAKVCDNTGIELLEGDLVEVSASGSFYGKISDLYKKAQSNDTLAYKLSKPGMTVGDKSLAEYCIYGKDVNVPFGSLLFQVCPESDSPIDTMVSNKSGKLAGMIKPFKREGNKKFTFSADRSGTLFVTVNDIYLDKGTIDKLKRHVRSGVVKTLLDSTDIDSLAILAENGLEQWSVDNIGEFLFCSLLFTTNDIYQNMQAICSLETQKKCDAVKTLLGGKGVGSRSVLAEKRSELCLYGNIGEFLISSLLVTAKDILDNCVNSDIVKTLLDGTDIDSLAVLAEKRPEMWFDDNIGEFLLNISITRNMISSNSSVTNYGILPKAYRDFESAIDNNGGRQCLWVLLFVVLFLAADGVLGRAGLFLGKRQRKSG